MTIYDLARGNGRRIRGAYQPGKTHLRTHGTTRTLCGINHNGRALRPAPAIAIEHYLCGRCLRIANAPTIDVFDPDSDEIVRLVSDADRYRRKEDA